MKYYKFISDEKRRYIAIGNGNTIMVFLDFTTIVHRIEMYDKEIFYKDAIECTFAEFRTAYQKVSTLFVENSFQEKGAFAGNAPVLDESLQRKEIIKLQNDIAQLIRDNELAYSLLGKERKNSFEQMEQSEARVLELMDRVGEVEKQNEIAYSIIQKFEKELYLFKAGLTDSEFELLQQIKNDDLPY